MIDTKIIEQIANEYFVTHPALFLVGVKNSIDNDIEVTVESSVADMNLDDCVDISHFIESKLDRTIEDYSLTVTSAGLTQPFKVLKQYIKFIGQPVEIVTKTGEKVKGTLTSANEISISVSVAKMEIIEGKKKKVKVEHSFEYNLSDIKSTKPIINIK